ncbi:MAG: hypothetical protein LQ343_002911 [Gyalolechia ehrenbergii]|nr:MAG: hypothetical protein LQ343_002911 [Gyalolechia ehrenbergii]
MAFPHNSLRAFLSYAKKGLSRAIETSQKVTIVTGNESADLDSLTASILYAYIRSLAPPRNAFTALYIPLLNIPAADISLWPEFHALFNHTNINVSHLITLDDLPTDQGSALKPKNTRWILVDHNKLQGKLGKKYGDRVHGVIDHHEDEGAVPQDADPEPRVVEKCGSCTSLVIRTLRSSWEASSDGSSLSSGGGYGQDGLMINDASVTRTWDAQIAKMALASILIDTANLTAEGKVEQTDREAVEYLEAKIYLSPGAAAQWKRDRFYEDINDAKRNIDGLNFNDILRKDYKQWTENELNLGMSSVVKPFHFLVEKAIKGTSEDKEDQFVTAIGDFMGERNLTIFTIMTTSTSSTGEFQRELYIQALSAGYAAASTFARENAQELQLEDQSNSALSEKPGAMQISSEGPWRKIWLQKDVSKSRKQVAPLLRKAIAAEST